MDTGHGIAVPVRVRGEDEVCKRLSLHSKIKYIKSVVRGEVSSWFVGLLVGGVGGLLGGGWVVRRQDGGSPC